MSEARFLDRSTPPHIATLVIITSLAAMQMNILLPSLPVIAREMSSSYATASLLVSGYLGVTAVLQLLFGALSDRYGRRPVVIWTTVVFIVASVAAALAPTIATLLAARFVQASCVGGYALSRAIVRDTVPMERSASLIGYITMGMALVPLFAPTLGGLLQDSVGWRAIFVLSALAGVATLAIVWADLAETNTQPSATITAQFQSYPALLSSRRFWGFTAAALFSGGMFFSFLGGGPLVAEKVYGLSPTAFGVYFAYLPAGYFVGNFLSGRYAERAGVFPLMIGGAAIACCGIATALVAHMAGFATPGWLFAPLTLLGVGNGMVLPSAMAGMVSVRPELAGSASGLGGALVVAGGAALSVVAGVLVSATASVVPLLMLMLAAGLIALTSAFWTAGVARRTAPELVGDQ